MGDLSAYASALGVKPARAMPNPAAGSGIVTADQQQPDTYDSSPGDIADLQKAIAAAPDAASKQTLTALLQQKTARVGRQSARLSPYAQALGVDASEAKPAPVVQGPPSAPPVMGSPQQPQAPQPEADEPWYKKAIGAAEAGATAVTGAVGGTIGGAVGMINNAGKSVLGVGSALVNNALGNTAQRDEAMAYVKGLPSAEEAHNNGASALTYQPRTDAGNRYVENVVQPVANQLIQAGPVMGEFAQLAHAPKVLRQAVGDEIAARQSPAAARAAFDARKAEPTQTSGAAAIPGKAPEAFTPPTIKDASPELQAAAKGKANDPVMQRHVEADTLLVPGKLTEGQAKLDPTLISEEMNGRGKGKAAAVSPEFYKEQGKVVAQNVEAQRAKAAPDIPPTATMVDHGQTLIDAYKQADEPVRADITAKYKALADANGGDLPVNGQSFVAAADAALKKANRTRFLPAEVQGILGDLREGGPMTFGDFEAYRTILAEQARKADRAGDGTASYAVGLVREALESLPMEGDAGALKPLADAARQAAKARFDALKADPAYKAAISDPTAAGEPSPLADKFFNAYVTKAPRANVALLRSKLGDNPQAVQTISAGTLDSLKSALKPDEQTGKFNQAAYNKSLQSIEPKIGFLLDPEIAYQAKALGGFAKSAQTDVRGAYVNSSNTLTGSLAEAAKTAATHGTNMAFGGIPVGSAVRKAGGAAIDALGANRATKKATAPGAGMTKASDFPGVEPK